MKTIKELEQKLDRELTERDDVIANLQQQIATLQAEKAEEVSSLEKRILNLELEGVYAKIHQDLHTRLIDDQNQYSRKVNLILDGLNVNKNDSDEKIRKLVIKEIDRLDIDIDPYEVDRAHRTGRSFVDKKGTRHTPVIVRFTSWRARNCFYDARFQSITYVKADITTRRSHLLQSANDLRESDSRASEYIEAVFIDRNCNLTAKSKDGRFLRFNSLEELNRLPNFIEDTLPPYAALEMARTHEMKRLGLDHLLVNLSGVDIEKWLSEDPNNTYVGRDHGCTKGSIFQNPYNLNDFDRKTAVQKYKEHIHSTPELLKEVETLRNKNLGCFCYPEECHAQVLLDILYN